MPELRPRALVIDKEPSVRALVCELLARLGFEAESAADGSSGLARMARRAYDLVVTEAWDVVDALRRRAAAMPVILISGWATAADAARARSHGVRLLCKPFASEELAQAVAEAVRREPGGTR